jgi:hypothetical protein
LAGLILLCLAWLALGSGVQQNAYPADHLERVSLLMQEPQTSSSRWRNTLYQSLTRLEHAPVAQTLPAWELLAVDGGDVGQANLILFCRRHGLPLPEVALSESASSLVERCLAQWGLGQRTACLESLQAGAAKFPSDSRFRTNLDWLKMSSPKELMADCTSRELAQAVLAARLARP